ncbi:hypothetical protein AFM11_14600 [Mycolicibacterium wolinskyi]|uniref:Transposase n=1 Tax=Mycolicibacterium wolinskyi TaxID=59750 RepID=A0A132PMD6_9MYCO|nr:DUF6262 family protein [Mycolicibacterium wolinskyi]KWX23501.1 hypothetical protein AFM11_14600 [Mycolicibacterium wolinskyi]
MTANDRERRTARLAEAAAARSTNAAARAQRAITKLRTAGQPITFVSVARTANVSTSFLYQHTQLRRTIEEYRTSRATPATTPPASSATVESLRTKLTVAMQRNRDLTEELATLHTENTALRSHLLAQRANSTPAADHHG